MMVRRLANAGAIRRDRDISVNHFAVNYFASLLQSRSPSIRNFAAQLQQSRAKFFERSSAELSLA